MTLLTRAAESANMLSCLALLFSLIVAGVVNSMQLLFSSHGCFRTLAALSRRRASLMRSPEIRFFAPSDMCAHSCAWNSNLPSWMLLNRLAWQSSQASPWFQPQLAPQWPKNGGYPHSRMYNITPRDHRSHLLSYLKSCSLSSMKASTISGAMNSADPTGVNSIGVVSLPRSKSQSLTGVMVSLYVHSTFSGFRSRCAIPL